MSEAADPSNADLPTVGMGGEHIYSRASSLADRLTQWVDAQGWVPDSMNHAVAISILFGLLLLASALLYLVFRPLVLSIVRRLVKKTEFRWDNDLVGHGVFRWLTHLLPGVFIYLVSPGLFHDESGGEESEHG